jgi:hypothetical protein
MNFTFLKYLVGKISKLSFLLNLLFFLFLIQYGTSQNQVSVQVQVQPPYSVYLSDYIGFKDQVVITLTNTTSSTKNVFLKAKVTSNTGFLAMTKEDYLPTSPIVIAPNAVVQLSGNSQLLEFFNEENIDVDYGEYTVQSILQDGILPEGVYTLCIDVFDFDTQQQLNIPGVGCKIFNIAYLNPPQLISPSCAENTMVSKNVVQNINFNWTPVISNVNGLQLSYDLYIVKVFEGDNPQDIIESAVANSGVNAVKISNINNTSYTYGLSQPILELGKYAWAVKAKTIGENYPITNDGLSNVCTFDYVIGGGYGTLSAPAPIALGPDCSCKSTLPVNLQDISANSIQVGDVVKTSKFEMTIKTITSQNGSFSGTGTIPMPILNSSLVKINVVFNDISIRKSGNIFIHEFGKISAQVSAGAVSLLPTADPLNPGQLMLDPSQTQSLSEYFTNQTGQLISNIKNQANSIAYNLPIGLDENVMTIALVNLVFNPDQAYFDAASVLNIIDGNSKVALVAAGVCIDENNFCGDVKMYLSKDFEVPIIGLKFKGSNTVQSTSITFDKTGFKNLHIGAEYTFPNGSLRDVNTEAAAKVTLTSDTEKGWNDWVAEVQFSPFYIDGFKDIKFGPDANNTVLYYDHSDFRNPDNIPSPYTSTDNTETPIATNLLTWRGFYIPSIGITLPPSLHTGEGKSVVIKAEKLIFDGGISGNISVSNILSIGDGSMDTWYYSIEQFKIDIWKNTFKQSSLNGKLVLPLSKEHTNASNQLNYTCTLSKPANSPLDFNFIIEPKDNVGFDLFWASGNLGPGTNIQILKKGNGDFEAKSVLFGQLTLRTEIDNLPDIKLAEINFQNFKLQSQEPYFDFGTSNANLFGLASPQHSLGGFVIDIDPSKGRGISLYTGLGETLKVGLKFKVLLKLVANVDFVPKAEVDFDVFGKIAMNGLRPAWDGLGADLNQITLGAEAKIGPVGVEGTISYFNDKAGSYGFMGGLAMDAKIIKVEAKAQFGYQKESNGGGYNYFFIDALVDLSKKGAIPVAGPLSVFGFMGGAFYNMTMNSDANDLKNKTSSITGEKKFSESPEPGVSLSGISYVPKKGEFAIKGGVLFGLTARDLFDGDGSLIVAINSTSGGINSVTFNINGRLINESSKPIPVKNATCMGKAEVIIIMNFDEGSVIGHAGVRVGVLDHISAQYLKGEGHINFYAGSTGWFVHIGRPWTTAGDNNGNNISGGNPVLLEVPILSKDFRFMSYFQCGSGSGDIYEGNSIIKGIVAIDNPPPIPNFIMNLARPGSMQGGNGYVNSSGVSIEKGYVDGGMSFGANFKDNLKIKYLIFYAQATFMAGFDLALLKVNGMKCVQNGTTIKMGVNDFYAKGKAYLGAKVDIGVEVDLFFYTGQISIVQAGVGAMVDFGSPNPTYMSGALGGYFDVLGGAIKGNFALKMYWGDECTEISPPESIPIIAALNSNAEFDENNYKKVITIAEPQPLFIQPTVTFNYKIDETFLIVIPAKDSKGENYREYRYYHIRPQDISINLSGAGISHDGEYYKSPLTMTNFKVTSDKYSIVPKDEITFDKSTSTKISEYYFDVSAKVLICNLGINSKNYDIKEGGYKNQSQLIGVNTNEWREVQKDGKVYVDERHIKFQTDCGIKYIEEDWLTEVTPFHRTQNNPLNRSKKVNENDLRKSESEYSANLFKPTYSMNNGSQSNSTVASSFNSSNSNGKTNKPSNSISSGSNGSIQVAVSNNYHNLILKIDKDFLSESKLCIPVDFENNFDFYFRVNTMNISAEAKSFVKEYYKITPNANKSSFIQNLGKPLPPNSYVIVQVLVKKRVTSSSTKKSQDYESNMITTKHLKNVVGTIASDLRFNQRNIPLESRLTGNNSEMEIFRWYFTTGQFNSYQDKMAALDIKVDTAIISKTYVTSLSQSGINESTFKEKIATYSFYGKEKFDFHDLNPHKLSDVFLKNNRYQFFDQMLADGSLGFAFDNKSQALVDDFLRVYFADKGVMTKYLATINHGLDLKGNVLKFANSYVTDQMLNATRWENVKQHEAVLQPLRNLPANLISDSDFPSYFIGGSWFKDPKKMFSIVRKQKIMEHTKSSSVIIPAHIITMKDIINGNNDINPVIIYSITSDMMNNFNSNVMNNVANGFNPAVINNFKKF